MSTGEEGGAGAGARPRRGGIPGAVAGRRLRSVLTANPDRGRDPRSWADNTDGLTFLSHIYCKIG